MMNNLLEAFQAYEKAHPVKYGNYFIRIESDGSGSFNTEDFFYGNCQREVEFTFDSVDEAVRKLTERI